MDNLLIFFTRTYNDNDFLQWRKVDRIGARKEGLFIFKGSNYSIDDKFQLLSNSIEIDEGEPKIEIQGVKNVLNKFTKEHPNKKIYCFFHCPDNEDLKALESSALQVNFYSETLDVFWSKYKETIEKCSNISSIKEAKEEFIHWFSQNDDEKEKLENNLKLLHLLLSPEVLKSKKEYVKKEIKKLDIDNSILNEEDLNFKDENYQKFLIEVRNKLLDNFR